MISKEGIKNLYKAKQPAGGYSEYFLTQICTKCHKHFKLEIRDGFLIIGQLDDCNPFKKIKYSCINSIQDLGDEVVVVLNTCIIIFNSITGKININIRQLDDDKPTGNIFRRFANMFKCRKAERQGN